MWALNRCLLARPLALVLLLFTLAACSAKEESSSASCASRVSPLYSGPAEASYCSTTSSYPGGVTISFTATFQRRVLGANFLGAPGASQPIRYAEIEVLNSSGDRVQCGETLVNGTASLALPLSNDTYTIRVNSRGNNSSVKASILNCPEESSLYSVQTTVVPDGNKAVSVNATATGDVVGGAFNILDRIVEANNFLRSEVSACGFAGCQNFTVAPKVSVYWEKGFNPNAYFGAPQSGISFYLPGYSRLFIMGGVGGDIDNEDTDHFDDSVILHEYGHFLEDLYSVTDSPGGSHSGNSMIDPRLAWSEAWGNFFQGAVRNVANYIDSYGNSSGSSFGYFFKINIEDPGACSNSASGCDMPSDDYEGIFREFAVTRFLWDIFDTGGVDTDADAVADEFAEIWAVFTKSVNGFLNGNEEFRNAGLLVEKQDVLAGASDWSSVASDAQHMLADTMEYARYVDNTGGCGATFGMEPHNDFTEDSGGFSTSNLLLNNEFFFYKHSGGSFDLDLDYTTTAGRESDLDLYVYNVSAQYGNASDIEASAEEYFDNLPGTPENEHIDSSLPAGDYLINVKIYTGKYLNSSNPSSCLGVGGTQVCHNQRIPAGGDLTFSLTLNGVNLCSAARP